jgi:hypothetical protein
MGCSNLFSPYFFGTVFTNGVNPVYPGEKSSRLENGIKTPELRIYPKP